MKCYTIVRDKEYDERDLDDGFHDDGDGDNKYLEYSEASRSLTAADGMINFYTDLGHTKIIELDIANEENFF